MRTVRFSVEAEVAVTVPMTRPCPDATPGGLVINEVIEEALRHDHAINPPVSSTARL